jgi:hypothetical protein
MSDIDLIPTDYRNRIWLLGKAKLLGLVIAFMLVITTAIVIVIHVDNGKLDARIIELQKQQANTSQQQDVVTHLQEDIQDMEHQIVLLNNLRGGIGALDMFTTIDRAMNDVDVWFDSWEYRRTGSPVENRVHPDNNDHSSIIPADEDTTSDTVWMIDTHMTIKGQAKDYSTLSHFVRQLYKQSAIRDVKILNTATAADMKAVDFNMTVSVMTDGGNS